MSQNRTYIAIDLKSFYASVECRERGLNPLTTNLVVADSSRTEKTVCLAVSPSLKKHGIAGRARLFEVIQRVREVNSERRYKAPGHVLNGKSYDDTELQKHPEYELDYIVATPQMKKYMKYSTDIYNIYLQYFQASRKLLPAPPNLCNYYLNSNKIQPKTAWEENRYPIFVASELRDCSKMLEKADIKIIDFDDFVFCTTESKSITFNVGLFIEDDFS